MKKRFLILAIGLVLLCSLFTGCEFFDHGKTDTSDRTMEFPEELKTRVLEDYLIYSGIQSDKKPDEIEYEFCGSYGDSTAIYFHTSGAYETPVNEEIAGYRFTYPDSRVIKIWNGGKFYKMSEALELGLINEDNVETIHTSFENIEFSEPYFIYEEKILCNVPVEENFIPGQIVITLDKGISVPNEKPDKEFFVGVYIVEVQLLYKWTNLDAIVDKDNYNQGLVLILPEEYSTKQATLDAIKIIEHIDGVKCAWPNLILKNNSAPNDPYYTFDGDEIFGQWALTNIEIEKVWDFSTGSQNILVGIIDSGIASHNDLNPNYSEMHALDFMNTSEVEPSLGKTDTDSHGTHIAGIIGASGNNNIGISGINWRISLVQMHAIHPTTSLIALANAINYAADAFDTMGIRILNFSIGAPYELSEVEAAIRRYTNAGGLFVCSTGNGDGNNDASGQHQYPSHYGSSLYTNKISNIISVTSNNIENERAFGARWGQETIDIYAPGSIILSTFPEALCNQIDDDCAAGIMHNAYGYHYMSGSSMATPHVTGVAALLLSVDPSLTAAQIKECILEGADIITIITGDNEEQDVKKLNAWGAFVYMIQNYFPGEVSQTTLFGTSYSKAIDASSDAFDENTFLHKIDARMGGTHNITVSGNGALKVVLYNENLEEIATVNNGASSVTLTHNLSSGKVYYLKATYTDSTSSGTVTMRLTRRSTSHTHSYTEWKYKTAEKHIQVCSICGAEGTVLSNHVIRASEIVGNKAPCLECGHMINIDDGFSQVIQNVAKVSVNGSYILTNGIVVLVDEDVEAYLNGTLVFYDKDKVPVTQ